MVVSKLNALMEEYVKITMMDLANVFVPMDFSGNFVKTVSPFSLNYLKKVLYKIWGLANKSNSKNVLIFLQGDPCNTQPSPCQHGGTCSFDEDLNVSCECTPEYEGDHCESSTNSRFTFYCIYCL